MPANYAYQENGHTLFSNQVNGDDITGVVRLIEIEGDEALEGAKDPGIKNSVVIKHLDQSGMTQYDVGGFICTKDKKNYQFSGLNFADEVKSEGNFG